MNKLIKYGIIGFVIFFVFSIIVYAVSSVKQSVEENNNNAVVAVDNSVVIDVEKAINEGTWYDITEEDKITLALSSETNIVSTVKKYLQDNKVAIFFVYGGPFDANLKGNYIICTGFNEDGKAKIIYPNDNFSKEWTYSYEGLIEFSNKVMLFDM